MLVVFVALKKQSGILIYWLVAAKGKRVVDCFTKFEEVLRVISHGTARLTIFLRSGIQVDSRVVPEKSYGAAMHSFYRFKIPEYHYPKNGLEKKFKGQRLWGL